ncbi:MAG TPA: glycosyltransferase family 4 protein [Dehalococcoidia bacterium]|nr:glycosyltransferase family 4 protein [Dehalococcoidia bacterium]
MRIAYVYDALYPEVTGGAERRYFELGERLAARGHDVHHVSWGFPRSSVSRHPRVRLHPVGRAPRLHDDRGMRTFREAAAFAIRSVPVLARLDVDVIDCSSIPYASTFVAAALRGRSHARLVVTWHEYMGERWHAYLRHGAAVASRVEAATARRGNERVAVSAFTARRLPAGPPTRVVENGVDLARIRGAVPVAEPAGVVVAGRLVSHKRTDLVLEALARVPGATAVIIGDGAEGARLEAQSRTLGLAGRVRFTGWLPRAEDLYSYLRGAKALVSLSEQEGFGMTVIEAQTAGVVPIIARSEFSAAADLVEDGVTGLIVPPDPGAVAEALRRVLSDGRLRAAIRTNCFETTAQYDWGLIADRMEGVYAEVPAPVERQLVAAAA